MLSIIVPTYNEGDNVFLVAEKLGKVLTNISYELIFVDDSTDDTVEKLSLLCKRDPNVRYEHRKNERGLGTAVVRGFRLARGEIIAVMDSDLQHPPEMLLKMLVAISKNADIVIPSRYISGGNDGGLNLFRKLVSSVARYLGKFILKSLRPISDPTSGFFMFHKSVIDNVELKPIGWKILIEILARGKYHSCFEIPYHFKPRILGKSKISIKEQWNYIRHLFLLMKECPKERRFFAFSFIGLSGVFINMFFYCLLISTGMIIPLAGVISAIVSMFSNFVLNDFITWVDIRSSFRMVRLFKYVLVCGFGIVINVITLTVLYYIVGLNYVFSNLIGISAGIIWNFMINNLWTWKNDLKNRVSIFREFD